MRLATFNILHGRSERDGLVVPERLAESIRMLDPDILALQEVDRDQPRSQLADLTQIASDAMGAVDHRFVAAIAGTPGAAWVAATGHEAPGSASYGIALLSRYPAEAWQVVPLPRLPFRFPLLIREPRKMVIVREEPRSAVVAVLRTPRGQICVAATHASFVPGCNWWQLRRIRRTLAIHRRPTVLMGDLNHEPPLPRCLRQYQPLVVAPTFPRQQPQRQLDHILVRGTLGRVVGTDNPELPLSDHRALVVDVATE